MTLYPGTHWESREVLEATQRLKHIGNLTPDNMDLGGVFDNMITDFVSLSVGYIIYYASIAGGIISAYLILEYIIKKLSAKLRRA